MLTFHFRISFTPIANKFMASFHRAKTFSFNFIISNFWRGVRAFWQTYARVPTMATPKFGAYSRKEEEDCHRYIILSHYIEYTPDASASLREALFIWFLAFLLKRVDEITFSPLRVYYFPRASIFLRRFVTIFRRSYRFYIYRCCLSSRRSPFWRFYHFLLDYYIITLLSDIEVLKQPPFVAITMDVRRSLGFTLPTSLMLLSSKSMPIARFADVSPYTSSMTPHLLTLIFDDTRR